MSGSSYKVGDLAVPATIMPSLLGMVGLQVVRHNAVVNTQGFRALADKKANQARASFTAFQSEVYRIQSAGNANSVDYSDIILSVTPYQRCV